MHERSGEVHQALRFERLLADLSTRFIHIRPEEVDQAIARCLGELVEFLDVDRGTFLELTSDGRLAPIYSSTRPGLVPHTEPVTRESLPWYYEQVLRGETLIFERLPEGLPEEARAEREYVRQSGMKSHIAVPLRVGGEPVCVLAVAAFQAVRAWPPDLIARLRLGGEVLANALYRKRADLALRARLAEITELKARVEAENVYLREEIVSVRGFDEIVGESPRLQEVLRQVALVAPTDTAVLLRGETGTGKELIAHAIHRRSPRHAGPLVAVNCAALPPSLIEAELFGHERGAFTGATAARPGRLEIAHGGTLFLDEVGDLGVDLQAKLLRALQFGEFERVGSTQTRRVDVRVIAATHQDLEHAMACGRFRQDLYYRLNVFPITLPPLRERQEDIPPLVWSIISRRQGALGKKITRIPRAVLAALQAYAWPGNVRELENVIERALVLATGATLALDDSFRAVQAKGAVSGSGSRQRLDAVERGHILAVLAECRWRINGAGNAAERLGLHPNTLRFRMKKLGITRPGRRAG
jgi:transcriptional regulator with GAF, ATPase, and Fis domain